MGAVLGILGGIVLLVGVVLLVLWLTGVLWSSESDGPPGPGPSGDRPKCGPGAEIVSFSEMQSLCPTNACNDLDSKVADSVLEAASQEGPGAKAAYCIENTCPLYEEYTYCVCDNCAAYCSTQCEQGPTTPCAMFPCRLLFPFNAAEKYDMEAQTSLETILNRHGLRREGEKIVRFANNK